MTINLLLTRIADQPDPTNCTIGKITVNGAQFFSMERPWVPNPDGVGGHPDTSCIPEGTYKLSPRVSKTKGKHWQFCNVELGVYKEPEDIPLGQKWGRSLVLMHAANWSSQLLGCVAPGMRNVRDTQGLQMVTNSQEAMEALRQIIGAETDINITLVREAA